MIGALQWITLAVCAAGAVSRIPAALHGRNRSLLAVYALTSLAVLLSIEGPYLAIDHVLGGANVANLLLRILVFAAVFLLGLRIARGFDAQDALRLIAGPVGIAMATAAVLAVTGNFLTMDTAGSSVGLTAIVARDPHHEALGSYYRWAGRLYPAYVMLALFPAMVRALRSSLPALVRAGAAMFAAGTVSLTVSLAALALPPSLADVRLASGYAGVLALVSGLLLIRMSRIPAAQQSALLARLGLFRRPVSPSQPSNRR